MGEFPAVTKNNHIVVITPDKDTVIRVWQSLSPRDSEIVTAAWMINSIIGVGYHMPENEPEQKQSVPYKIFSKEEIQARFTEEPQPFKWAPGLLGASISQQRFEELIQKELVA